MKHIILILTLSLLPLFSYAQQPQWELFYPDISGPIAVDPTNSDVIYITGDSCYNCGTTGMWKTTDDGQTWNYYGEGWFMGNPEDILVYPDNPDVILVGGGPFVGVLRSTNGGQSWERADSGFVVDHHGYFITDLAYDSKNKLFYAADNGTFCGVFRSTVGIHWQRLSDFCPWRYFIDEENDVLYAGSWGAGVWKSVDAGSTWVQKNKGLTVDPPNVFDIAKVKGSKTLYAATFKGIYKSLDGGENWFSVNDSLTKQLTFWGGLVISETDTNTVFAGARSYYDPLILGGLYVSRNGGLTWGHLTKGLPDSSIYMSADRLFLNNYKNILYASIIITKENMPDENNLYYLKDAIISKVDDHKNIPSSLKISLRNYPNPFNSQTSLLYTIPKTSHVTIKIYNILGKEVITLLDENQSPGEHKLHWNGTSKSGEQLSSGIYLAIIKAGGNFSSHKLLILK